MYQNQYYGPMNDFMQSDVRGPFGMFDDYRQQLAQNPFLQGLQPERDLAAEQQAYLQDVQGSRSFGRLSPEHQQEAMARHQQAFNDHYQQMPQQPGLNFGPQQPPEQPGPQRPSPGQPGFDPFDHLRYTQMPIGHDGRRGNQFGAGGPGQFGAGQMMRPQFGGQPQQQQWTPPSVNMPMSQQGQPWMGNEMQQRYGAQVPQPRQQNPFQGNRSGQAPVREMRLEDPKPRSQAPQPTPTIPPNSGGRGGGSGAFATGPMPGSGFNPFSRMDQQRQPQVNQTYSRR